MGIVVRYTITLPQVSERGAAIKGPRAKPSTYMDKLNKATVSDTWNFSSI